MNKKIVTILLIAIVLLTSIIVMIGGKSNSDKKDEWVVTYQRTLSPTDRLENETTYYYNDNGILTESVSKDYYEEWEYYESYTSQTTNKYIYDNDYLILEKKEIKNINTGEISDECIEYSYDKKGNCIESNETNSNGTITYNYEYTSDNKIKSAEEIFWDGVVTKYEYEYDDKGNASKYIAKGYSSDGKFMNEVEHLYNNIYDDNNNLAEYQESSNFYYVNTFDEYGNCIVKKTYATSIWSLETSEDKIFKNGTEFTLMNITYYTYKRLSELDSTDSNSSNESTNVNSTTANVEKRLSDECDEILATGTNAKGDYYEVVANNVEDYTGLSIYVGVIKNNEWLLEPTKDMPFVTEENGFKQKGPETGDVYYVGNNCFLAQKVYASERRITYMNIVYNVENGKSYSTAKYSSSDYVFRIPIVMSNSDKYLVVGHAGYYTSPASFIILNKIDMSTKIINIEGNLANYSNISEDIFAVALGYDKYSFYNLQGNVVIDLTNYNIPDDQELYFVNGECSFEIINNNDTRYRITIDKNGKVLNNEILY